MGTNGHDRDGGGRRDRRSADDRAVDRPTDRRQGRAADDAVDRTTTDDPGRAAEISGALAAMAGAMATMSQGVEHAGRLRQNPRQISDRIAMARALWRDLVIGFAAQLGALHLGFTQLAAVYAIDGAATLTIGELAEHIGRSPSATSRIVSGLVARGLLEIREEEADRRQKTLAMTEAGSALLGEIDRARADQFLAVVRPMPAPERALIAMSVAALAERAFTRRGKLIRSR
jgi:DNA-binding MarR family transcriptional regulator